MFKTSLIVLFISTFGTGPCQVTAENSYLSLTNYNTSPPKRCYLEPDSGDCNSSGYSSSYNYSGHGYGSNKISKRYFYSTLNYNCEAFPYSGCGGNDNNFRSYEECMHSCFSIHDISKKIRAAREEKKCYFRNVYYEVDESIRTQYVQLEDPCNFCQCVIDEQGDEDEIQKVRIRCIQPKCAVSICGPRNFSCCGGASCCMELPRPACVANDFRCRFDKEEAYEDSNFVAKDYPCFRCYCDRSYPGFPSTHICRERGCGIGLNKDEQEGKLLKGCTPIYKAGKCCPAAWKCPKSLTASQGSGDVSSE